jgi:hypothetical protein
MPFSTVRSVRDLATAGRLVTGIFVLSVAGLYPCAAAAQQSPSAARIARDSAQLARAASLASTCGWTAPYETRALELVSAETTAQAAVLGDSAMGEVLAAVERGTAEGKLHALCAGPAEHDQVRMLAHQLSLMLAIRAQALIDAEASQPYDARGLTSLGRYAPALGFLVDAAKAQLGPQFASVMAVQRAAAPKILASVCVVRSTEQSFYRNCPANPDAEHAAEYSAQLDSAESFAQLYVASASED